MGWEDLDGNVILSDFYAYIVWELIVDLFIPQVEQTQKSHGLNK